MRCASLLPEVQILVVICDVSMLLAAAAAGSTQRPVTCVAMCITYMVTIVLLPCLYLEWSESTTMKVTLKRVRS